MRRDFCWYAKLIYVGELGFVVLVDRVTILPPRMSFVALGGCS
jgi:hypothetical protein